MRSVAAPRESAARRYRIEKYLTEGGMGAIYLGKKVGPDGFERELVLKQLLPEFTSRPEFRDLFFREAKISATLDHVNIVRTLDLVRSDDALFIVGPAAWFGALKPLLYAAAVCAPLFLVFAASLYFKRRIALRSNQTSR